jgi:hypothetical protein
MNQACDVAADELIAFTEEDLPERRMKQLEAHIPECPHCQERLHHATENAILLRKTMPEPDPHVRHDLLVQLYKETEHQSDHPDRNWTQVASLTAVGATFALAAVMLWSGLGQFIDAIPMPFQQASQDQSQEWVTDTNDEHERFEEAPVPSTLGPDYPLSDYWVESDIRMIIYHSGESDQTPLEVSQFFLDDPEPPGYMERIGTVDGVAVYVDDPEFVREIRWTADGLAHHVQMYVPDPEISDSLHEEEVESIVQAFLESR